MKKYSVIAVLIGILVSINGCGIFNNVSNLDKQNSFSSDTENEEEIEDTKNSEDTQIIIIDEEVAYQEDIVTILNENTEYLNKYVKASSNKNIEIFGLEEEFKTLKEKSEQAKDYTTNCINTLDNKSNNESIEKFYSDIKLINEQFESENDKMKEAKRTLDVESLEYTVDELAGILDNYSVILQQFCGGD